MAGVFGYTTFQFLESNYYSSIYSVQVLRYILIFILSLFFFLRKSKLDTKILFYNLGLFLFLIFEFEIELNTNEPDFQFNYWFPIGIAMFFQSNYQIGKSRYFIIQYISYFFYFAIRVNYSTNLNANNFMYYTGLLYQIMIFLFFLGYHYFLFLERYEQIQKSIRWRRETKKRIYLERELVFFEERDLIFADIHDTLGGRLIELKLRIEGLEGKFGTKQEFQRLKSGIIETIELLKNRVLSLEEVDFIRNDLYWGLKNYLVRRYSVIEREIKFTLGLDLQNYKDKIDLKSTRVLYQLLQEIVNNDLKYGVEVPEWIFDLRSKEKIKYLTFGLRTKSKYAHRSTGGRGWKILELRVRKAGGSIRLDRDGDWVTVRGELRL